MKKVLLGIIFVFVGSLAFATNLNTTNNATTINLVMQNSSVNNSSENNSLTANNSLDTTLYLQVSEVNNSTGVSSWHFVPANATVLADYQAGIAQMKAMNFSEGTNGQLNTKLSTINMTNATLRFPDYFWLTAHNLSQAKAFCASNNQSLMTAGALYMVYYYLPALVMLYSPAILATTMDNAYECINSAFMMGWYDNPQTLFAYTMIAISSVVPGSDGYTLNNQLYRSTMTLSTAKILYDLYPNVAEFGLMYAVITALYPRYYYTNLQRNAFTYGSYANNILAYYANNSSESDNTTFLMHMYGNSFNITMANLAHFLGKNKNITIAYCANFSLNTSDPFTNPYFTKVMYKPIAKMCQGTENQSVRVK